MEKVREVAVACIGRAVMFGTLAIGCVMVGFSFNPVSAFRSGAVATRCGRQGDRRPKHVRCTSPVTASNR